MADAPDLRQILSERRGSGTPAWAVSRHLLARGPFYSIAPEQLTEIVRWTTGLGATAVRIRKTDESTCFGVETDASGEWWLGEQDAPRPLAEVAGGGFGTTIDPSVPVLLLSIRQAETIARTIREHNAYYAEIDVPDGDTVRFNMDDESDVAQRFEMDAACRVRSFF